MNVAVIKYNAGNIKSMEYALARLGITPLITDNPEEIMKADKVIFPGVGSANATMPYLEHTKLDQVIKSLKQPVLGICLGMQLMCAHCEEGNLTGMGIFDSEVKRFVLPEGKDYKIPHMGWNNLENLQTSLFDHLGDQAFVYFVHSYYVPVNDYTIATSNHIEPFSAALHKDNFWGLQFHPEKSGEPGAKIIKQFINL